MWSTCLVCSRRWRAALSRSDGDLKTAWKLAAAGGQDSIDDLMRRQDRLTFGVRVDPSLDEVDKVGELSDQWLHPDLTWLTGGLLRGR